MDDLKTNVARLLAEFNAEQCPMDRRRAIQGTLRSIVGDLSDQDIEDLRLHRVRVCTRPSHSEEIIVDDFPSRWVRSHHKLVGRR